MKARYCRLKNPGLEGKWGILISEIDPEHPPRTNYIVRVHKKNGEVDEVRVRRVLHYNEDKGYAYCQFEHGPPRASDASPRAYTPNRFMGQPESAARKADEYHARQRAAAAEAT